MPITKVKACALSFTLENAPRRGVGQPIKKDTVIVRVKTEDGIVGYGEAHHALAPTLVADGISSLRRHRGWGLRWMRLCLRSGRGLRGLVTYALQYE